MKEIKKTICPYDCPSTCGLLAEVEDGKITRIKNDPEHPVSGKLICNKMQRYEKSIYSEERILTPLKRTGEKGQADFESISWEEAVALITDKWKEIISDHGSESILPVSYSGVMSDIQKNCGDAFFAKMNATGLIRSLCSTAKGEAYLNVTGGSGCLDPRELCDSDMYIFWGSNLKATRIQLLAEVTKPENRDKYKVLIDTYGQATKEYCDEVILTRPGRDGALALAMMQVLVEHNLTDEDFLAKYTEGWQEFKATLGIYTPEWAEEETGVSAEVIRNLALKYGRAKAPAIVIGSGNSRHGNGSMTVRLIIILSMLTGAWARKGGGLCGCTPVRGSYTNLDLIKREDFRTKSYKKININQLAGALSQEGEEKIRSIYVYGGNPLNTVSNQKGLMKALEREDLFTVVHERFMTDTARYADIILPATFSTEHSDIYRAYGYSTLGLAYKVTEPLGECKSNWDTFALLAAGMGYEEAYFRQTEEEMLKFILDHPTDLVAELSKEQQALLEKGGSICMGYADHLQFKTKSGKAMIANDALEYRLPKYFRDHGGNEKYALVAGPSSFTLNSTFTCREDLVEKRGRMVLWINAEDAREEGINDGDIIEACNDLAAVRFVANVSEEVTRGTLVSEGAYTMAQSENGLTINALTHERLSDRGEATTLNDNTVNLRKI